MKCTSRVNGSVAVTLDQSELSTLIVALGLSLSFHRSLASKATDGSLSHTLAVTSFRKVDAMLSELGRFET